MKYTTHIMLAIAMITSPAFATTTFVDVTFDDEADGNIENTDAITNGGTGGSGAWDGGTTPVVSGVIDTTSTDGYVNFSGGAGFEMDLNSSQIYTFSATVDVGPSTGTMGLFGQLTAWTPDNTGYWMRLQGDNDIRWNFRRDNGSETFALWDTTALLAVAGDHTIEFVLDAGADTASLFVNGSQVGSSFDLNAASVTGGTNGTLGHAGSRVVVGAYNATAGNRFDGTATSYSITAVPEPSSTALLGLGGLALILRRRK